MTRSRSRRNRQTSIPARLAVEQLEDRNLLALVLALDFGESSGASVVDYSGFNNNGTITGATRTNSGKFGNALSFDGVNDLVTVADANSLDLTNGMTLEAWVRPAANPPDFSTVLLKERPNGLAYALYGHDGANRPPSGYINRGTDVFVAGGSVLPVNTWSHLAVTYNASVLRLYVNGTQVATRNQTGNITTSTGALKIGGNAVWGEYFNGLIDEVRVYNNALTATQIQSDMNTPINGSPDTTPPTVSLTAPSDGSTVAGTTTVSATASDNVAVAGVQFRLDGVNLGAEDTSAPYSISWNTTTASAGTHTLTAIARDTSGNTTTSATFTVTVDNSDTTAPSVSVTAPSNNATVSSNVTVSASASDNVGVVGVQFRLDGTNLGVEDTTAPYSITWNSTTASNGAHQITAVARDAAGNTTTSAVVNVTVSNADTVAPTVSLTAPANNATVSNSVTVSANASDNIGVVGVQFLLNGQPLGSEDTTAPYSISWDTTTVANGSYSLTARARDAAGNITDSTSRTVNVFNTNPALVGQWSNLFNIPIVAISSVLLKDGRILMWDGGPACIGSTSARVWDPQTGSFTPVPIPYFTRRDDDIFCSGQVVLADGRVMVVGGHDCDGPELGIKMTNFFDPATMTWTRGPDLNYRRWYPTVTLLPDGRVLATAGSDLGNTTYIPIPEVYDPVSNTWTALPSANQVIPNYPFMYVLPDGRVVSAGSDESTLATRVLDVNTQTWTMIDPTVLDGASSVMYLPGKIMKAGSSYNPDPVPADNNLAVGNTYVLDMTQTTPAWQQTASLNYPRAHFNMTLLPDGSVLATGGSRLEAGHDPANAIYPAELWSPTTQTWTVMDSLGMNRMYHSIAVLLPDGRVLSAGGGHNYVNNLENFDGEIFSPPYLFKGSRPTITSAPSTIEYGSNFFVETPNAADIASVSLVRNGAVTHFVDMDQRYVPLEFEVTAQGLTVAAPANSNLAPPGYYMLFIVNADGVPSVAPFVRFPAPYEDTVPPSAPASLDASGSIGTVVLNWSAATDNIAVDRYNVYRSTTPGFTPSPSTLIAQTTATNYTNTGLSAGTYYYVVRAVDQAGNIGGPSPEASAVVTEDTEAPTVSLTAPANGATLTGVANVTANATDNVVVAGVQFLLNGSNLGSEDTSAPYSFSWNTTGVANGTYTLAARARDAAGNTTTSTSITVTVSNSTSNGLVAAYGFEEGSGSSTVDVTGNALNGTLSNATWTTSGKFGKALSFNGSNAFVTIADNNLLDLTNGMTLEAWVRPAATATDFSTVLLKERPGGLAYALYGHDGANRPPSGYINRGTDVFVAGGSVLPVNTWSHLAVTYNASVFRLYVNGTQVATRNQTGNITTSTGALKIGGNAVWGEYFNGLIDEVRVYNRALSATEIQSDMNAPVGGGSGGLQLRRGSGTRQDNRPPLTLDGVEALRNEAVARWQMAGISSEQLAALSNWTVQIVDLPGRQLGFAAGGTIYLDVDAAGRGWFLDPTPSDDGEFRAGRKGAARGRVDLLSVLTHEIGHALGFEHDDRGVMAEAITVGKRRLPDGAHVLEAIDHIFADPERRLHGGQR